MLVKELKEILDRYKDNDTVAFIDEDNVIELAYSGRKLAPSFFKVQTVLLEQE